MLLGYICDMSISVHGACFKFSLVSFVSEKFDGEK